MKRLPVLLALVALVAVGMAGAVLPVPAEAQESDTKNDPSVTPWIDPGDPHVILVATDGGSVHLSRDEGLTWEAPVGLSALAGMRSVAVLDDGWLLELGTHDELLAMDGLYAHLWRLQASERPLASADERSASLVGG